MLSLPEDVRSHFLKGEHTVGLTPGRVNCIWTDQTNESTTMEKGQNAGDPCHSGNIMNTKELSEVVTLLFQANGEIRIATDKFKLMQRLTSLKSYRTIPNPDTVITDGVAMLCAMYWPANGRVHDLVSGVASCYLAHQLISYVQGVHLIFDHYREFSIKSGTRAA